MKTKILLVLMALICAGIKMWAQCPYSIEKADFVKAAEKDEFKKGVAIFEVKNLWTSELQSYSLVFSIVDGNGENPLQGENTIICHCENKIAPGSTQCLFMNLDEILGDSDLEGLKIIKVYLQQAVFENGKVWSDRYGLYATED